MIADDTAFFTKEQAHVLALEIQRTADDLQAIVRPFSISSRNPPYEILLALSGYESGFLLRTRSDWLHLLKIHKAIAKKRLLLSPSNEDEE